MTVGVEFSFNGVMYQQVDGVAMGSPLGPVLANISLDIRVKNKRLPDYQASCCTRDMSKTNVCVIIKVCEKRIVPGMFPWKQTKKT